MIFLAAETCATSGGMSWPSAVVLIAAIAAFAFVVWVLFS